MCKKKEQLGMNPSTASGRLNKNLLFMFVKKCEMDVCHQCGKKIDCVEELSIEHKTPWLDSEDPVKLFFDLDNIAFSHKSCNYSAARKPNQKYFSEEERLEAQRGYRRKYDQSEKAKKKRAERSERV